MVNRIGHYELTADLGSGAMGKVYCARDTRLDRVVALKVLWPQLAEQPAAITRFEREARAAARLRHANVVAVYDIGAADGYHYLAMEYVAGCTLRELLKEPLPPERAIAYFRQILAGLGAAHEQGIIHRDLKPGNILIEAATDTVKLADFGLARLVEEEASLTQPGEMLGTLEYMAPELGRGESAGPRSDLYAAGVVLYRLLAGRFPFQGATPSAIMKAHECGTYPPVTAVRAGLPPQANAILARLLACEPANRYSDCQTVFADLERWERREDIRRELPTENEPIDHELERHRVPRWMKLLTRTEMWYRYQWLELTNRTELRRVQLQQEVLAAEAELGTARRRLEEATLLRNRVRSRADDARAAMQQCEQAAEQACAGDDDAQARQLLAARREAQERHEELTREANGAEQLLQLAHQEFAARTTQCAELRHTADLLLARRRRARLEMSVLGVLPAGEKQIGARVVAALKLLATPLAPLLLGVLLFWTSQLLTGGAPAASRPMPTPAAPTRPAPAPAILTRRPRPTSSATPVAATTGTELSHAERAAVMRQLAVYEPFDGVIRADGTEPRNPEFVSGKFGEALRVRISDPLTLTMPEHFLQEATIMSWVRIDNDRDRSLIWYYDALYPSCVYYPDHQYRLSMQFITSAQTVCPMVLAENMQPRRYYHLTQSWGPRGFCAYLDGRLMQSNRQYRDGQPIISGQSTERKMLFGRSKNTQPGDHGPGWQAWQMNQDGVYLDDLAVFRTQLSDDAVAYFATKGTPVRE